MRSKSLITLSDSVLMHPEHTSFHLTSSVRQRNLFAFSLRQDQSIANYLAHTPARSAHGCMENVLTVTLLFGFVKCEREQAETFAWFQINGLHTGVNCRNIQLSSLYFCLSMVHLFSTTRPRSMPEIEAVMSKDISATHLRYRWELHLSAFFGCETAEKKPWNWVLVYRTSSGCDKSYVEGIWTVNS